MAVAVYYPSFAELDTIVRGGFDINIRCRSRTFSVTALDEYSAFELQVMGVAKMPCTDTKFTDSQLSSIQDLCMMYSKRITYLDR